MEKLGQNLVNCMYTYNKLRSNFTGHVLAKLGWLYNYYVTRLNGLGLGFGTEAIYWSNTADFKLLACIWRRR